MFATTPSAVTSAILEEKVAKVVPYGPPFSSFVASDDQLEWLGAIDAATSAIDQAVRSQSAEGFGRFRSFCDSSGIPACFASSIICVSRGRALKPTAIAEQKVAKLVQDGEPFSRSAKMALTLSIGKRAASLRSAPAVPSPT